jgi:hypothetical protein
MASALRLASISTAVPEITISPPRSSVKPLDRTRPPAKL